MVTDPATLALLGIGLVLVGVALCWKASELAKAAESDGQGDEHVSATEGDGDGG